MNQYIKYPIILFALLIVSNAYSDNIKAQERYFELNQKLLLLRPAILAAGANYELSKAILYQIEIDRKNIEKILLIKKYEDKLKTACSDELMNILKGDLNSESTTFLIDLKQKISDYNQKISKSIPSADRIIIIEYINLMENILDNIRKVD